jgi:hypothetical protein
MELRRSTKAARLLTEEAELRLPTAKGSAPAAPGPARSHSHARKERRKIWNILLVSHCSIIGTCMSVGELRRLARRVGVTNDSQYPDYEMHGWFVEQMSRENSLSRAAQKHLDSKFEGAIRKTASLEDETLFFAYWEEALDKGLVAGAYWAMLTHPALPSSVENRIFGDIHMMSHISGASHRSEARAVCEARREKAEVARRLNRIVAQRDEELVQARAEIAKLTTEAREIHGLRQELERLRGAFETDERQLRCGALERENAALHAENQRLAERATRLSTECDRLNERVEQLQRLHYGERAALGERHASPPVEEQAAICALSADDADTPRDLCGRCLLYVGGRPRTIYRLKEWISDLNGLLIHHDGGLEDSPAILGQLVRRADAVFFPIDCVSHSAVNIVKSLCDSHGVPYAPLSSAGAAAFTRAVRSIVREAKPQCRSAARQ